MMIFRIPFIAALFGAWLALGADDESAFQEARKLEQEGHDKEAFFSYLAIPGGEYAAVALARGASKEYLTALLDKPGALASPRARLVEADLLLASGRRDEAKAIYQALAASATKTNWGTGQVGYYPAEPQSSSEGDQNLQRYASGTLGRPFAYGPGSHRDNWLLRRLIALDLTNEASQEF
jgi:hypothetical protein